MTPDVKASDSFAVGDYVWLRPDTPGEGHRKARWAPFLEWGPKHERNRGQGLRVTQVQDGDCTIKVVLANTLTMREFMEGFWIDTNWCMKTTLKEIQAAEEQKEGARQIRSARGDADAILAMQLRQLGLSPGQIPFREWRVGDIVQTSRLNTRLVEHARNELFEISAIYGDNPETAEVRGTAVGNAQLFGNIGPCKHLTWIRRP